MEETKRKYLLLVKEILAEPLPDTEEKLIEHLSKVVAHFATIGFYLAESNSALDMDIKAYYDSVAGKEILVAEKKAACDAAVAKTREYRDKIESLLDAMELRVSLGQSILKQQRNERRMSVHQEI